jgi:competence protein ComEA
MRSLLIARRIGREVIALGVISLILVTMGAAQKTKNEPPEKPLDLNTATVEELVMLPDIGPATAKAIVRFREKSGPFRRVEDLLAVRGITKRRLEKLRPLITVVEPPAKAGSKPQEN